MNRMIIDVRKPSKYDEGHVEGAVNIPSDSLADGAGGQLDGVPKDTPILVYCASGARAQAAVDTLKEMGFTNLTNGINRETVESKYI